MTYKKSLLFFSVVIMLMTLDVARAASIPDEKAQNYLNTVTFDNQSGEYGAVKLVGTTARTVDVPQGQKRTVHVAAGEYYILVRYGSKPEQYSYAKGDPFTVLQTATQYSCITITLHPVVNGNYRTRSSSREEFDKAMGKTRAANPHSSGQGNTQK
ncbi:MAG TPA: hypothetical protein ACFYEF_03110 [Candidatus Wunengus sp. YC63]|uniref:hypothetical protein n=1 Tax=Candidatus Wunengus sp. YC63 TaxID=3367699 RepID=UPI00402A0A7A